MNAARSLNEKRAPQSTIAGIVAFSDPMTDETLVAAAKRGDEKAFETLVRRHRPRILALALRYTRVREDAEDVVQQALQKAFIYLNSFEGKSLFSTWITYCHQRSPYVVAQSSCAARGICRQFEQRG